MNIEPLESRIAPAAVVTFIDLDGDLVTISLSKGTHDQLVAATGGANGLDDHRLQVLDLPADPLLDGVNISITATPKDGKGDGFVNVGRINASGRLLGAVLVDGDLGEIDVGTVINNPNAVAMQSLTVHSLGLLGTSTGAADLRSDIVGSVKSITIKTDLSDALVTIHGAAAPDYATLGALTIGGSLRAPTSTGAGTIKVDGDIGPVKIGGSVVGGSQASSAQIGSLHGSMGNVTVGGDVIGSAAGFTGYIFADQNMGNVTIGGNLKGIGGSDGNSGLILAASGSMGNVKIGGSIIGGVAVYSGTVAASTSGGVGTMGTVTVGGDVIGGSAARTGYIFAGGDVGKVTIGQDLKGGSATYSGSVHSAYGSITGVSVRGSVLGGDADYSGSIAASTLGGTGKLGAVIVGRDVLGGGNAGSSRSGLIFAAGDIASVTIGGSLKGGASNDSGLIISSIGSLGAVKIGGDVAGGTAIRSGDIVASVNIGAVTIGGSLLGGTADFAGSIRADYEQDNGGTLGPVSIHGDLIGGSSAAGGATGYIFADRAIASITIGGSLLGGAGFSDGSINTGHFAGGDVKVGAITIGGSVLGGSGSNSGGIYTYQSNNEFFGAIKVGGDWKGGSGQNSGRLTAYSVASITVGGSFVGGSAPFTGYWSQAICGAVKIGRDLDSARLIMNSVKTLTIGRSIIGGSSTQSGAVLCGSIGSVVIGHDIRGGDAGNSNVQQNGALYAGTLGSVTIGGSVIAGHELGSGQLTDSGSIGGTTIGSLTVKGSLLGNSGATANIGVVSSLKSLTVGGRVEFGLITAGFLSGNENNADAQIGTVKVTGDWIASSLIAGVNPTNGQVGDGNDTRMNNASTDVAAVVSKIASITIGGQVLGVVGDPSKTFGFGAEQIGSFKVGGVALALKPLAHTDKFGTPAGQAGSAIPVGFTPGNVVNDGFAVHVFEV